MRCKPSVELPHEAVSLLWKRKPVYAQPADRGIRIPALYGPARAGDVRDSQADVTAAVRDLDHRPQFTLEQGLRLTLDWYRNDLAAASASGE
jgi:nucleoside-diphosphate-sugar epimerase